MAKEMTSSLIQIEFEFTLPKGYIDEEGNIHREGVMRLATAIDEIAPMRDPRVKSNEAYLTIILLSRVINRLGSLRQVNPKVIENLFSVDLAYLQNFYRQINELGNNHIEAVCPECQHHFTLEAIQQGD
jgi:hypothetical protein